MQKRTAVFVAVGCSSVVAIVLIVGTLIASFIPNMFEWVGQQAETEQQRAALAEDWQAPGEDASPKTFFPPRVSGYALSTHDKDAAIPDIHFDLPGWHALYLSGKSQIDVFAYQVTDLEREALFGRVSDAYDSQEEGFKRLTRLSYRCFYSSTRHHQNHLWWIKGWLLVFRTEDSEDREDFVREFLKTTTPQDPSVAP